QRSPFRSRVRRSGTLSGDTFERMSTTTAPFQNFIDGEFVAAAEGGTDAVVNPANGEEIAQVASSTQADVDRAVAAARRAFDAGWSTATPGERSLALLKIADA